jgi:hypothetical protein
MSSAKAEFQEICEDIVPKDLASDELVYNRPKDKADRSLDAYKFYINALYVGMTRAVKNLFVVEREESHRLPALLGVRKLRKTVDIFFEISTEQEWQEEARRLEKQGKLEQAQQIREEHRVFKQPDWNVMTLDKMHEFRKLFFSETTSSFNHRIKLQLLEAALFYNDMIALIFMSMNAKPKRNPFILQLKEKPRLMNQLLMPFRSDQIQRIEPLIKKYGVDYRNHLNLTPLMLASLAGAVKIAEYLVNKGADRMAMDNVGRTAHQFALKRVYEDENYALEKFPMLHEILAPPYIETRVMKRNWVLPSDSELYYVVTIMLALQRDFIGNHQREHAAFSLDDFLKVTRHLPNTPDYECLTKREQLSAFLKKNEVFEARTFIVARMRKGYYCLAPTYNIKVNGVWTDVIELCSYLELRHLGQYSFPCWQHFATDLEEMTQRFRSIKEASENRMLEDPNRLQTPDESLLDWEA